MSAKFTFLAWDTPIKNAPLKLALLQLANNADDNRFSYYSISKMAISCGMSERSFMRKIKELEEMKVLTVERRSNRPSLYSLIGDEMGVTLCHLQEPEVTESHPEVTESHLVGDRESHDLNNTPDTSPESIINSAFDYFWLNMFLTKKAKPVAIKSFKKAIPKNIDPMLFARQLTNDTRVRFENKQFGFDKMNPSTYLNQARWEDDYTIDKQQSNNKPSIQGDGTDWRRFESEML